MTAEVTILDHGYVKFIEAWGSDERIIEAARMSTNKGFQGWGPNENCKHCGAHCESPNPETTNTCRNVTGHDFSGDEKLLAYLYNNKHMTPFEMAGMVIEVQAPIMVFREWHRHRTQSYNEMSARYTELPNMFYVPELDRIKGQSKSNKQASGEGLKSEDKIAARGIIEGASGRAYDEYLRLLDMGVAREIARLVLPVNIYSRMRASANLRNWLAFLTLRMDQGAQHEIRQYANIVAEMIHEHFTRTYSLFVGPN